MPNDFPTRVKTKIAELTAERDAITHQIGRYQAALEVYEREMNEEGGFGATGNRKGGGRRKGATITIAGGIEQIMEERGGTAPTMDVVQQLSDNGIVGGSNQYGTVIKTMQRDPNRFYKLTEGEWGLVKYRGRAVPLQGELTTSRNGTK